MAHPTSIIPIERIDSRIHMIRGQRVLLDSDLAELYEVSVSALNQAVKRNRTRFPADFMFQLTRSEAEILKSQTVISSSHGGRRRSFPYAFTEQGVAMLSSVLRSDRAVRVNIEIMRAFVRLRHLLSQHTDLHKRVDELEKKFDAGFRQVFDALRAIMTEPARRKPSIGYHTESTLARGSIKKNQASLSSPAISSIRSASPRPGRRRMSWRSRPC